MTNQEVAKILKQNHIVFGPKMRASQFSSAAPFLAFLDKAKLRHRLQKEFGIFRGRSMLQILIGIILGARNMNDIGKVASFISTVETCLNKSQRFLLQATL